MKCLPVLAILASLTSAPLAAAQHVPLAGVADEETTIPSGQIRDFQRGKGDVLFVRDRIDRWYRLKLTEGCLGTLRSSDPLVFGGNNPGGKIDRFTRVLQPAYKVSCHIESIRRSAAPPQVDSESPVTLD
jgi:hypothetical protein